MRFPTAILSVLLLCGALHAEDPKKGSEDMLNPMLRIDKDKTSSFEGKMFGTKDLQTKLSAYDKDQKLQMNTSLEKNSSLDEKKPGWLDSRSYEMKPRGSGFQSDKDSAMASRNFDASKEVDLASKAYEPGGRDIDAGTAPGFGRESKEGSKRYLGPESPEDLSELGIIQKNVSRSDAEGAEGMRLSPAEIRKLLDNPTLRKPKPIVVGGAEGGASVPNEDKASPAPAAGAAPVKE
jgi:hypothetical protein